MNTPPTTPRQMICPNAPMKKSRNNNWENDACVLKFLNDQDPSIETTAEAYYFRDINMNISIQEAYEYVIDQLKFLSSFNLMKILNEKMKTYDHRGLYDCLNKVQLIQLGW